MEKRKCRAERGKQGCGPRASTGSRYEGVHSIQENRMNTMDVAVGGGHSIKEFHRSMPHAPKSLCMPTRSGLKSRSWPPGFSSVVKPVVFKLKHVATVVNKSIGQN